MTTETPWQERLREPFPEDEIIWKPGSISTKNDVHKAMAMGHMDGRMVMERLDEIIGPQNWQDRYEDIKDGIRCGIGINVEDEWIWKWDAAPYTDFEAVKGGHSDALKRAAVKWGIGRYLYDLPKIWVPCKTYERNGKIRFSEWIDDPWDYIRKPSGSNVRSPKAEKAPAELKIFVDAAKDTAKAIIEARYKKPTLNKLTKVEGDDLLKWFQYEADVRPLIKTLGGPDGLAGLILGHVKFKYRTSTPHEMKQIGDLLTAHVNVQEAKEGMEMIDSWERTMKCEFHEITKDELDILLMGLRTNGDN